MNALPAQTLQRSFGRARLRFALVGGKTRLRDLHQSGSAKAFVHEAALGPDVVFLNTSGGMTGGDRMQLGLDLGPGTRVTATTQTAERAYRSDAGVAEVEVMHRVAEGAHLDWLPQETILFDRSALRRRTEIALAGAASCLMLETIVLGRAAMGEVISEVDLVDRRLVTRDGQPVLMEPLVLGKAALGAGLGVLQGARAFASVALVAQGAEAAVTAVRQVLDEPGVSVGASGFDGKLTVRLMATDAWPLRRQVARLLQVLRRTALPRTWQI